MSGLSSIASNVPSPADVRLDLSSISTSENSLNYRRNITKRVVNHIDKVLCESKSEFFHSVFGTFSKLQFSLDVTPFSNYHPSNGVTFLPNVSRTTRINLNTESSALYRSHVLSYIDNLQQQLQILLQSGNVNLPNPTGLTPIRTMIAEELNNADSFNANLSPAYFRKCREYVGSRISNEISEMASVHQILQLLELIYLKGSIDGSWNSLTSNLIEWINNISSSDVDSVNDSIDVDYATEFEILRKSNDIISNPNYWRVLYRSLIRGKFKQVRDLFSQLLNSNPFKLQQLILSSLSTLPTNLLSESDQSDLISSLVNDLHKGIKDIENAIINRPDPIKYQTQNEFYNSFLKWRSIASKNLNEFDTSLIKTLNTFRLIKDTDASLSSKFKINSIFERLRLIYLVLMGDVSTVVDISCDWQECLVSLLQFCFPTTSILELSSLLETHVISRKDFGGQDMHGLSKGILDSICLSIINGDLSNFIVQSDKYFDKILLFMSVDLLMNVNDSRINESLKTFKIDSINSNSMVLENNFQMKDVTIYDIRDFYVENFADTLYNKYSNFCWNISIDLLSFIEGKKGIQLAKEYIKKRTGYIYGYNLKTKSDTSTLKANTKFVRDKSVRKLQSICEKYGFLDLLLEINDIAFAAKLATSKRVVKVKGEKDQIVVRDSDILDILIDLSRSRELATKLAIGSFKNILPSSIRLDNSMECTRVNGQISDILSKYVFNEWSLSDITPIGFIKLFKSFFQHLLIFEMEDILSSMDPNMGLNGKSIGHFNTNLNNKPYIHPNTGEQTSTLQSKIKRFLSNVDDLPKDKQVDPVKAILRLLDINNGLPSLKIDKDNVSIIDPIIIFRKYCGFLQILLDTITLLIHNLAKELILHEFDRRNKIISQYENSTRNKANSELNRTTTKQSNSKKRGRSSDGSDEDTYNDSNSKDMAKNIFTPGKQRRTNDVSVNIRKHSNAELNFKNSLPYKDLSEDKDDIFFLRTKKEIMKAHYSNDFAENQEMNDIGKLTDKLNKSIKKIDMLFNNNSKSLSTLLLEIIENILRPEHRYILGPKLIKRCIFDTQFFTPIKSHSVSIFNKVNDHNLNFKSTLILETIIQSILADDDLAYSISSIYSQALSKTRFNDMNLATAINKKKKNAQVLKFNNNMNKDNSAIAAFLDGEIDNLDSNENKNNLMPLDDNILYLKSALKDEDEQLFVSKKVIFELIDKIEIQNMNDDKNVSKTSIISLLCGFSKTNQHDLRKLLEYSDRVFGNDHNKKVVQDTENIRNAKRITSKLIASSFLKDKKLDSTYEKIYH